MNSPALNRCAHLGKEGEGREVWSSQLGELGWDWKGRGGAGRPDGPVSPLPLPMRYTVNASQRLLVRSRWMLSLVFVQIDTLNEDIFYEVALPLAVLQVRIFGHWDSTGLHQSNNDLQFLKNISWLSEARMIMGIVVPIGCRGSIWGSENKEMRTKTETDALLNEKGWSLTSRLIHFISFSNLFNMQEKAERDPNRHIGFSGYACLCFMHIQGFLREMKGKWNGVGVYKDI